MSRLAAKFNQLTVQGRKALIPFITAGDPAPDFTVPMMHAMVNAGADIIELGVPFSDPMADGPVIQRASERALEQHMSLRKVLLLVKQFRQQDQICGEAQANEPRCQDAEVLNWSELRESKNPKTQADHAIRVTICLTGQ